MLLPCDRHKAGWSIKLLLCMKDRLLGLHPSDFITTSYRFSRFVVGHAVSLGVAIHKAHEAFPVVLPLNLKVALHPIKFLSFGTTEQKFHRRRINVNDTFFISQHH